MILAANTRILIVYRLVKSNSQGLLHRPAGGGLGGGHHNGKVE